jgi:hypothetical protein
VLSVVVYHIDNMLVFLNLAGQSTYTVVPESRKRRQKGTQCPGVYLGHLIPGGYKYGDLALQVGGVSYETVKYGLEFCETSTQE